MYAASFECAAYEGSGAAKLKRADSGPIVNDTCKSCCASGSLIVQRPICEINYCSDLPVNDMIISCLITKGFRGKQEPERNGSVNNRGFV